MTDIVGIQKYKVDSPGYALNDLVGHDKYIEDIKDNSIVK